jgi:hypothetical protein
LLWFNIIKNTYNESLVYFSVHSIFIVLALTYIV